MLSMALISLVLAWPVLATNEPVLPEKTAAGENKNVIHFSGEVKRGEDFVKDLGAGLTFRLNYSKDKVNEGWRIWIGDPLIREADYCSVVTPPYRGINALNIQGWHFRNIDNSGPNDGSVNAPREQRDFSFIFSRDQYDLAWKALRAMLWHSDEMTGDEAGALHESTTKAKSTLIITKMELGNLALNERAWIEHLSFRVTLEFPPGSMPEMEKNK
jgi:hypothetical protein